MRPADAALLDPARLAGVATEEGGEDDHTSVMLRSLGVPAVLGATGLAHAIRPGDVAVVDGAAGTVTLNPGSATLSAARRAVTVFARERQRYAKLRRLPAETADGEMVELQANLELPIELPLVAQSGAVGIGLLRTEFLFMNRETVPDEDTQAETYRGIVEAMGGDPVAIRVLDWGGEKDIEALVSAGIVPDIVDVNSPLSACAESACCCVTRTYWRLSSPRSCKSRNRRTGSRDVADGDHGRRSAGCAGGIRAGSTPPPPPGRTNSREAAAARHHDRDAGCGSLGGCAGAGGRLLRHRHQCPDGVYVGG